MTVRAGKKIEFAGANASERKRARGRKRLTGEAIEVQRRDPPAPYNNKVKRDEIETGSAGKQGKWKKGNNGEGVINLAQSSPAAAKLSFKF